jgi:hypothetical protein
MLLEKEDSEMKKTLDRLFVVVSFDSEKSRKMSILSKKTCNA